MGILYQTPYNDYNFPNPGHPRVSHSGHLGGKRNSATGHPRVVKEILQRGDPTMRYTSMRWLGRVGDLVSSRRLSLRNQFGNIQNTNNQTQVGKVTTVAPTSMTQTSKASASCDKGSASIQKQSKLGGNSKLIQKLQNSYFRIRIIGARIFSPQRVKSNDSKILIYESPLLDPGRYTLQVRLMFYDYPNIYSLETIDKRLDPNNYPNIELIDKLIVNGKWDFRVNLPQNPWKWLNSTLSKTCNEFNNLIGRWTNDLKLFHPYKCKIPNYKFLDFPEALQINNKFRYNWIRFLGDSNSRALFQVLVNRFGAKCVKIFEGINQGTFISEWSSSRIDKYLERIFSNIQEKHLNKRITFMTTNAINVHKIPKDYEAQYLIRNNFIINNINELLRKYLNQNKTEMMDLIDIWSTTQPIWEFSRDEIHFYKNIYNVHAQLVIDKLVEGLKNL
ncbi:hypothetical protein C2G38_2040141 [Gigaspora rosea]|uniref:Uncharacterized protein n=1 Tax=Gigaspora rosea TaxID=44941 RepID=A0A397UZC5_9GLOM|nr:hypothetical protein C2G38_2040141 [Gigaspora rosea]